MYYRLLILSLMASLLTIGCQGHGGVFIVRHADRDGLHDRLKNPEGYARAQALADHLDGEGIKAIYSTNYRRTKDTARPLANRLGIPVQIYGSVDGLKNAIRNTHLEELVVVVGHSNTVPQLVTALGASLPSTLVLDANGYIPHNHFHNLLFVVFNDEGGAGAGLTSYGAPPP